MTKRQWSPDGPGYMTTEEGHKVRHEALHMSLDELVADYLRHNKDALLGNTTVLELMQWSGEQAESPTSEVHKKE